MNNSQYIKRHAKNLFKMKIALILKAFQKPSAHQNMFYQKIKVPPKIFPGAFNIIFYTVSTVRAYKEIGLVKCYFPYGFCNIICFSILYEIGSFNMYHPRHIILLTLENDGGKTCYSGYQSLYTYIYP